MTADDAAGRIRAFLDGHYRAVDEPGRFVLNRDHIVHGYGPDDSGLDAADLRAVLDEREQLTALLGIGADREQWDAVAEAEGRRYEAEQTGDTIVGYLAYRYEDMKSQRHILLREIEEQRTGSDALAARVAELEAHQALLLHADAAERAKDVRAVAKAIIMLDGIPEGIPRRRSAVLGDDIDDSIRDLRARFANRIAEVDCDNTLARAFKAAIPAAAPEPCDGDCDCDCQPGQPCLCPERDCYCGPCPVCGSQPGTEPTS